MILMKLKKKEVKEHVEWRKLKQREVAENNKVKKEEKTRR